MAVTREIHDKGAPKIQHGQRETGQLDASNKQAIWKTKPEDKDREGIDDEGTLCLNSQKLDVRDGLHQAKHWICCWSRHQFHEQSEQRALGNN